MKLTIITLLLLCLTASCSKTEKHVGKRVAYPQTDIIYDSINGGIEFIDTLLKNVSYPSMSSIDQANDALGHTGVSEEEMNAIYRQADSTWLHFKTLCAKKQFKEAYNYYYDQEQTGDFLLYLRNTEAQYVFFNDVLNELNRRFDPEHALRKLASNMDFCLLKTLTVIQWAEGKSIPPYCWLVALTCIDSHKQLGEYEEAREIVRRDVPIMIKYFRKYMDSVPDDEVLEIDSIVLINELMQDIDSVERSTKEQKQAS